MAKAKLRLEDIVKIVTGPGEAIYRFHLISQALRTAGLMPEKKRRQVPKPGASAQRRLKANSRKEDRRQEDVKSRNAEHLAKFRAAPVRGELEPEDADVIENLSFEEPKLGE